MNDPKRILIVFLGLVFIGLCTMGIKGHMDSVGYKNQVNYTTAVQAPNKDLFNYAVDSQQGRVLANGTFTTDKKNLTKFPEMTQAFTYVRRIKEHYTMHEVTTCTKSGCTTTVYYTWDEVDRNEQYASKISLYGREYSPAIFNLHAFLQHADACTFTPPNTEHGWFSDKNGCDDGDFYLNDDDRYTYDIVPTSFNATFLASTYGGTLKPFNENYITLQNKDIGRVLKDVGKYQLIGFWVVTVLLILLTIGAVIVAYGWVMEDGIWSTKE